MSTKTAQNSSGTSDTKSSDDPAQAQLEDFHEEIDGTLREYHDMTSQRRELSYLLKSLESKISQVQPRAPENEDMRKIERILTS